MSNQDTRALILIKGVVDDCSLDVVESMRRIRELASSESTPDPFAESRCFWCNGLSVHKPNCSRGRVAPPVDPDPIAELEAMGGRLFGGHIPDQGNDVHWYLNGRGESAGNGASISDLRAAAARLLARVRGGAS